MIGLGEEKLLNSAKAEAEADKVNTEIISMLEGGKSSEWNLVQAPGKLRH